MGTAPKPIPVEFIDPAKFWAKVDRTPANGCWFWKGKSRCGTAGEYGLFTFSVPTPWGQATVARPAHRVAYALTYGDAPPDHDIMHTCDTPLCVRPDHLRPGTTQENTADKVAKGRQYKGERIHTSKFTAVQVGAIRRRYAAGQALIKEIAHEYAVGWNTIEAIVHGRAWKSAGGPIASTTGRTGSRHPASKLTESNVAAIRQRLRAALPPTHASLAREFGVTKQVIGAIVRRRIWKHVA